MYQGEQIHMRQSQEQAFTSLKYANLTLNNFNKFGLLICNLLINIWQAFI